MNKADKIYLENTNLMHLYKPDISNIREIIFVNQAGNSGEIYFSKSGDFRVDEFVFEIGGAKKGFSQIKDDKNSFVAADNLKIGFGSKIPLWLFGLMY